MAIAGQTVVIWCHDDNGRMRLERTFQPLGLRLIFVSSITAIDDDAPVVVLVYLPPLDDTAFIAECVQVRDGISCIAIVPQWSPLDRIGGPFMGVFDDYILVDSDDEELAIRLQRAVERVLKHHNPCTSKPPLTPQAR
jgi:hypothetical protein